MPWIALNNQGWKLAPEQAAKDAEYTCPECGDQMTVVRRGIDGTARHFRHPSETTNYSGGGGVGCASVAESDIHLKWKSLAASQLAHTFENRAELTEMEHRLPAPVSEKDHRKADAAVVFNRPDPVLGRGIVAEVQHKNESKDVIDTTHDFTASGFAIVWLNKDDFSDDQCLLNEADFRYRAQQAVWPDHVPEKIDWKSFGPTRQPSRFYNLRQIWTSQWFSGNVQSGSDAILPPEQVDKIAQDIKQDTEWGSLFTPSDVPRYITQAMASPTYHDLPKPIAPPDFVDEIANRIRRDTPWSDRFSQVKTSKYLIEMANAAEGSTPPDAKLPNEYIDDIAQRLYRDVDWDELFDSPEERAEGYINNVQETLSPRVTVKVPAPISQPLLLGDTGDPNPPPNPFDDIQCKHCGRFWHASTRREECERCGARVDIEWNVETNRISEETLLEHGYR